MGRCNWDYVIEFNMRINSFAPNYASHPIARGEVSDGSLWVWMFYLYGANSDGLTGRLEVANGTSATHKSLSGRSQALSTGRTYHVLWVYNEAGGGTLYIDRTPVGGVVGGGKLPTSLSNTIHYGKNVYDGLGRPHSDFDGSTDAIHIRQIR